MGVQIDAKSADYQAGYRQALNDAAKACGGEACIAAGESYQTSQGEFWDAGGVYGQARFDCEQLILAMTK
ncbi:hypothetical protein HA050_11820 [Iodobacter sp. HSC-16F04]|uniref:Uncharacterized protein n=1 Tax=Iodobacter violaceini TaxID=3044271 RepID=A0ABX0L0C9_9NEIS|nr:hypothetical protein [Iodobacter violacea]NHQ86806.1 hypothetical protein [Iodobacter violacea]